MRIVVDIGHPAHVHFFKYYIQEAQKKGHKILITVADKDIALKLLEDYHLDYVLLGRTGKSLFGKILSVPILDGKLLKAVKAFKPDLFLGLGSIRCTHVARLLGKHSIIFNDTEATIKEHILYYPFANRIVSPRCFGRDFGKKHIRYDGYHELAYLHPNRFQPNKKVLDELNINPDKKLFIIRFISWEATHDIGQKGFSDEGKIHLVNLLNQQGRVIITSEGKLPQELEKYQLTVSPTKMHDLLYYADMYIGEGATMASEAAVLGTPVVFLSTLVHNYLKEQAEQYQLMSIHHEQDGALAQVKEWLAVSDLKKEFQLRKDKMLKDKVDVTDFMVNFIEDYAARYMRT
ncbi:MAG: DUF354 domain-containing protein [Candidatus Omnitrophica bacterium]|nr:DUF354 domain-containing protein [Candidatus Omnitrophota bacterium]